MRSIHHPGTPDSEKVNAVSGFAENVTLQLKPGTSLLAGLELALRPFSAKSAVLRLKNGAFEPFCYVMPALSKSPAHAVYFSDRYDVAGKVRLETASVTFGQRDKQPWLHCHAVWLEPDGTKRCGHLLPEDILITEAIEADVTILRGVGYSVVPDRETNFSLFVPVAYQNNAYAPATKDQVLSNAAAPATQKVFALRLSPNVDVCDSLESFCQANHISSATVLGGVGSTVGVVFEDARVVEPFVTEMLITKGVIRRDQAKRMVAQIDISVVDYLGGISEGRLKRGENPVLVTFELVLAVDAVGDMTVLA